MITGMLVAASMHLQAAEALQGRNTLVNRNTPAWIWEHLNTEQANQQSMPEYVFNDSKMTK